MCCTTFWLRSSFYLFPFAVLLLLTDFILCGIFTWFCLLVWNMWVEDHNQHRFTDPLGGNTSIFVITCFLSPLLGVWAMYSTYGLRSKSKVLWICNSIHSNANFRCFFHIFYFQHLSFQAFIGRANDDIKYGKKIRFYLFKVTWSTHKSECR